MEGDLPEEFFADRVKYLNNIIEADHGKLKQLIRQVQGFKTRETTYAMIMGFEVMRAFRKGQASAFDTANDVCGEARIVKRAFGLGASALAEAVHCRAENPLIELSGFARLSSDPELPSEFDLCTVKFHP